MTIEFRCPNCEKKLRTGDDKAGHKAKCPQCGTAVEVPAADVPDDFSTFEPTQPARGGSVPRTWDVACPLCGASNDPQAARCHACGEELAPPVGRPASLAFGDIFSAAFEAWKENLGLLVGATVLVLAAMLGGYVSFIVLGALAGGVADAAGDAAAVAIVVTLVVLGIAAFVTMVLYLGLGYTSICLAVARRDRTANFGALFAEARRLPTAWLNMVLVYLAIFAVAVPGLGMAIGGVALIEGQNQVIGAVLALVGYGLYLFATAVVPYLFWSVPLQIVDGERGLRPLSRNFRFVKAQPALTVLLILLSVALSMVGTLACGVGLLFSTPLTVVLYAVAYDRLRRTYPA